MCCGGEGLFVCFKSKFLCWLKSFICPSHLAFVDGFTHKMHFFYNKRTYSNVYFLSNESLFNQHSFHSSAAIKNKQSSSSQKFSTRCTGKNYTQPRISPKQIGRRAEKTFSLSIDATVMSAHFPSFRCALFMMRAT